MDRARGQIERRLARVAAMAVAALALWAVLPDGEAARVERLAACEYPAKQPRVERLADGRLAMRLRVLLWNVEGLPWPIRSGREEKLARIADWIAKQRDAGRGPDILFLHKAFTPDASRIAAAGDFAAILPGPSLDQQRRLTAAPSSLADGARWSKGEAAGKWLDGGLYLATDLPVQLATSEAFGADSCGGYDCLSNKGGQVVAVALPGAPAPLFLFNTHRNSREPSGVSAARAEAAHGVQTRENDGLLAASGYDAATAIIAAGDFNNYRAGDRMGAFASDPRFRLVARAVGAEARGAPMTDLAAWTGASDLVGFRSSDALMIEPLAIARLFDGKNGPRLSDHDAQYMIFRISWRGDAESWPDHHMPCPAA